MIELIEELEKHKYSNNDDICEKLIDIIKNNKINSKEELLAYENKSFNDSNLEAKIDIKYKEYILDVTRFDNATNSDIIKLKEYEYALEKATDTMEKCKYLILIYEYVGYMLFFPYEAYLLIINDNLN